MTMQPWFMEAKLGIFIHWGIYAVNGIPESWAIYLDQISHDDYMKQLDGFTAERYDPAAWVDLFKRAGARYVVLTTKHHDGVALWDTQQNDLSVVHKTPAGRDLLTPYVEAVRAAGLNLGLYFSHLDWSHPDYAPQPVGQRTYKTMPRVDDAEVYAGWPAGPRSPEWERFLKFHRGQLTELAQFKPDLWWFDGDWTPQGNDYWQMDDVRDLLVAANPDVVFNSRMRGYGDYQTPEQGIPVARPEGPWEFCVTINDSWGYQKHDHNHKSVRQLVRMFSECIGMGGNMLLDVGPYADGSLQPEQVERLEGLGAWISKHAEAIYPTEAGLPHGHVYGTSTLSKDKHTLYVFLFDRPWDQVSVKGIRNPVKRVSVVGSDTTLTHKTIGGAPWANIPGMLWIDVPEAELDPNATVLKIELEGPLDLYSGPGHH
ncbi:MAG: alpha-L-fucosidase [Anaerolineae bacterium]|nr:alpha-L-fucosidase [Anaerolineae bacterium]